MIHDFIRLNDAGTATLECFVLDNQISSRATKTRPAMVICPGGAYLKLANREAEPVAARFLGMGYNAFILRYPVYVTGMPTAPGEQPQVDPASHYPEQLFSLMQAMAYVRSHADEWDIDATRIYALGFSAGGHVVGSLAEHWDDAELLARGGFAASEVKPRGVVLCYPMVTATLVQDVQAAAKAAGATAGPGGATPMQLAEAQILAVFGKPDPTEADYDALDLRKHVRPDMPRTFVWQTAADDTLRAYETADFVAALMRAGVACEFHLFQDGPHGISLADETSSSEPRHVNAAASRWAELAQTWLALDGAPINRPL
jgi:acetyl esterase/lipase